MSRENLARLVVAVLLALGGWWLADNTEWVDEDRPVGASGEALTNPAYAFEQLLRRLGMQVEHHEALDTLPPPQARLVLLSADWAFIPGRVDSVKRWVQQGGHLVVPDDTATESLRGWLPADLVFDATRRSTKPNLKAKPDPLPAPEPASAPALASVPLPSAPTRTELISTPPLWGDTERVVTCHDDLQDQRLRPRKGQTPAWTLARHDAVRVARLPVGQGSVTLLSAGPDLFMSTSPLRCDMPLLLAAAVQAERGATTWVYLHEKRQALLPWIWHQGWIAVVLALVALAAALWRGAVRFGPLQAEPPRLRRSIVEQMRGLGAWLQRGGTEALLAAQQRALDDAAARALPRYRGLPPRERAAAIADATGLPHAALATAMVARFSTRAELAPRLQLLETARRRLS